jgi:hypothetical protein
MLPIAADIAARHTRYHAQSALPNAPVIDDTPPALTPRQRRRVRVAAVLRRLADRLEPAAAHPRRGVRPQTVAGER